MSETLRDVLGAWLLTYELGYIEDAILDSPVYRSCPECGGSGPKPGDYVLATKFEDGGPKDHWCVGFYERTTSIGGKTRHHAVDKDGKPFRANGFRRVANIPQDVGEWLIANAEMIEHGERSLWEWCVKCPPAYTDSPVAIVDVALREKAARLFCNFDDCSDQNDEQRSELCPDWCKALTLRRADAVLSTVLGHVRYAKGLLEGAVIITEPFYGTGDAGGELAAIEFKPQSGPLAEEYDPPLAQGAAVTIAILEEAGKEETDE